jgi:hypothetical protein
MLGDVMTLRLIAIALAGCLLMSSPAAAADEATVREMLASQTSTAYLQLEDTRLERIEPRQKLPNGALVFQKFLGELRIHGARVIVFEEADGTVRVLDDSTENLVRRPGLAAMTSDEAAALVESLLETPLGSEAEMVWFRTGNEAVLAWEVTTTLADTGAPVSPTHMETVVDAVTGEMLSQRQIDTNVYTPENAGGVFPRIVINDDIGVGGARLYAAPFDAVVEVAFGCTGTLIAPNVILSARHCGVGAGDTIVFGDNLNGGGDFFATVQSSFLPDGGGSLLDGGDVSILTLTAPVPAAIAEPMRLIDETDGLEGMLCATVGYGFNGLGSNGHGFSSDGWRWGGENIIDVYGSPASANGSNIISTDFDNGTNAANTIGGSSRVPVEFEATTAPGDSGGPVLVLVGDEWVIAGVLSGGTTSTSVYGDISWWTGTAIFQAAIEVRGGEFIDPVELRLPGGLPEFVSPLGGDTLAIEVVPSDVDQIVPGSGTFHVDTGSGFQSSALDQDSANLYTAVFPASECLTPVAFFVSFQLESGAVLSLPAGAPQDVFTVLSSSDVVGLFEDSFDTNQNWAVSGNATDGQWQRAVPNNGDRGDPEADAEIDGAGFCFVTDNGNIPNDNSDVDGGSTVLTSPVLDAAEGPGETAFLSYFRWYSNDFGGAPNADIFVVEISNDGGASWTNLETVGPAGPGTGGGWIFVEHRIADIITPTANMRVRFNASDLGEGSVVEAGVDEVTIRLAACEEAACVGDVDGSGVVDFTDLVGVLALWGPCPGCPEDLDGSGVVGFDDLVTLLAAWGPCP